MNTEWFSVQKIDDSTFCISEWSHWEETHCYLLLGTKRAILIDTGLGVSNIKNVVDRITSLPVTVLLTHAHWDHIGGLKYFEDFYCHEKEQDWLRKEFPLPLEAVKANLLKGDAEFPDGFDSSKYEIFQGNPARTFRINDFFDLGDRNLYVIETPGHSPGHCCFYEPEKERLYSGDLIYYGCLDAFYPTTNPQDFADSVSRLNSFLPIKEIYPGHHKLPVNVDLLNNVNQAFQSIDDLGKLHHGTG